MSHVPTKLTGAEFEKALMDASGREERNGILTMGRYGVDGVIVQGKTMLVPSKPDFEGVLAGGRQVIIEAKVCSGPSFPMQKTSIKPRQVEHMLRRSAFNVPCFLVIHFNERRGQNFFHPAITVAVPVSDQHSMWREFVEVHAEAKRTKAKPASQPALHRDTAQEMGRLVPWVLPPRCRKPLPDLLSFLWPELRQNPFHDVPGECPGNPRPRPSGQPADPQSLTLLGDRCAAGGDPAPEKDEWAL